MYKTFHRVYRYYTPDKGDRYCIVILAVKVLIHKLIIHNFLWEQCKHERNYWIILVAEQRNVVCPCVLFLHVE